MASSNSMVRNTVDKEPINLVVILPTIISYLAVRFGLEMTNEEAVAFAGLVLVIGGWIARSRVWAMGNIPPEAEQVLVEAKAQEKIEEIQKQVVEEKQKLQAIQPPKNPLPDPPPPKPNPPPPPPPPAA